MATKIKRALVIEDLIETIKISANFVMPVENMGLSENIAVEVAVRMAKKWGGMSIYPKI